jgi:glycerate dehydrogenase
MKIVWLESESLSVDLPKPESTHKWVQYPFTNEQDLASRIADAEILVINKVKIGLPQLELAPELKAIAVTATGTDNVDLQACAARSIKVKNVLNYGPQAVAEHAFACLLQLVRRVPEWQALVQDGAWSRSRFFCLHDLPMRSLNEMTLAILGKGAIGQKLAQYAKTFDMNVLFLERYGARQGRNGYVSLEEGLVAADVLSLHCPLNDDTRGMVNDSLLSRMKKGSILLNTARGGLVDFECLRKAMQSEHLYGAALDVLDMEPPPHDHPMLQWHHPRLIITPHVAWGTEQAQKTVARMTSENIESFLKSMA